MKIAIKNKSEMKYINAEDILVGGISLLELFTNVKKQQDVVLSLLKQSQNDYHDEQDKYNGLISFLSDYLLGKTNNVYNEENAIKEQLNGLLVANTEPIDNVLIINEYIAKVERVGTLIRPIDIPDDIANGYWKLVDGKYILDKDKYNQMWSTI